MRHRGVVHACIEVPAQATAAPLTTKVCTGKVYPQKGAPRRPCAGLRGTEPGVQRPLYSTTSSLPIPTSFGETTASPALLRRPPEVIAAVVVPSKTMPGAPSGFRFRVTE